MKMTHKQKVELAKRMPRTKIDNEYKEGRFTTEAWERRRIAVRDRVRKQQGAAHERAVARKKAKDGPFLTRAKKRVQAAILRRQEAKRARHAKFTLKQERQAHKV